ncbi:protein-methionine-sulfoxide reductase heme-binding subunit MsrQ [Acidimangrovimonas sediminis]|uniref:protein-methionine-sulfoxide reductase heme-binding subunit MsrQ n=1 Tax=Acidimangrovimonas sediminis TaxID=2056283 RepID=UPI000C801C4E|nr:protein-methionine-sulfoxide reductase heme-binding subunit MsrQ [Acidimangrovimonas sediminis]
MERIANPINTALRRFPPWLVYVLGSLPFLWVVWLTLSGGIGVDPVAEIEHRLGFDALYFLIGGLAITPLRRLTGINLIRYRRQVGLVAFAYVVLHMLSWLIIDMGLWWQQALSDLYKRPYLLFGLASLILLTPLAVTSNNISIRRMGKNWRLLHWLVYPAVLLGVVHYLWQFKVIPGEGWFWLGVTLALLGLRLWWSGRRRIAAPARPVRG